MTLRSSHNKREIINFDYYMFHSLLLEMSLGDDKYYLKRDSLRFLK